MRGTSSAGGEDRNFSLEHDIFEIFIRHPSGDIELTGRYIS